MDRDEARQVLISALRLAKERVTGDDLAANLGRQQEIGHAIERLKLNQDADIPGAAAIRMLLGHEDSFEIRDALAVWGDKSP